MKPRQVTLVAAVALTYAISGGILYRQRVISPNRLWDSDLLVFLLPSAAAFAAFFWLFSPTRLQAGSGSVWLTVRSLVLAAVATAVTFWAYASVAFTRYGT
jgi:hypothetical protein